MLSDEIKNIISQIKGQGKMNFLSGATEGQISIFEKRNGVILPEQYKKWLQYDVTPKS